MSSGPYVYEKLAQLQCAMRKGSSENGLNQSFKDNEAIPNI